MLFFIHLFIKSTLLMLVVGGLLIVLQKETAQLRHFLISRMMIGLVLLPLLLCMMPSVEVNLPFSTTIKAEQLSVEKEEIVQYEEQEIITREVAVPIIPSTPSPTVISEQAIITTFVHSIEAKPVQKKTAYLPPFSTKQLLSFVWFFGGLFVLFRFVLGAYIIRQITKKGRVFLLPDNLQNQIDKLTNNKAVIYSSSTIKTPMTWGFLRPIILLPTAALDWEEELLKIVLVHEGMHIRRADYWWHLIGLLAVSYYWWHPLIWALQKQQVLEREKACDEAVLQVGIPIETYAQSLVTIAKKISIQPLQAQSVLAMATVSQTKKRIMAILNFQQSTSPSFKVIQWIYLLVFMSTLPLLAGLNPTTTISDTTPFVPKKVFSDRLLPIETVAAIPFTKVPISTVENTVVPTSIATKAIASSPNISSSIPGITSVSKLPNLATKLPIVPRSEEITVPRMSTSSGLYGVWKEGKSTYKIWTYGTFQTLKSVPYIQAKDHEAMIVIEETRKTLLEEKKFQLVITQAPYNGGLVATYVNDRADTWSGGYKEGEPVYLWWIDKEWKGEAMQSRDEWISKHLNGIARTLELYEYEDFIEVADRKNTAWWSVIEQQQQLKKKWFISDDSMTLPPASLSSRGEEEQAASFPEIQLADAIYIENKNSLYGTWKDGKNTFKVYTYGAFTVLSDLPYIQTNSTDAIVVIEQIRKTLLGDKKYRLIITQAPDEGSLVQSYINGKPNSWSGGYKKGDPFLLWWENEEWGGFNTKNRDKWIANYLENIAREIASRQYKDIIEIVDKDDQNWSSVIEKHQAIKQERFLATPAIKTEKAEEEAAIVKLADFPYQALTDKVKPSLNKKVGRTIAAKTKSGCSGCSNITKTKYGTLIKTTKQPAIIETLNIHLADNKFKSIDFQLHLYKVKDGQIQHRLTDQPAFFSIDQAEGWVKADLSAYNIPVQGDVLVMLEPVKVTGRKRMLFFSLSPTFWMYPEFHKKNKQSVEDFWDNSFALYFTLK